MKPQPREIKAGQFRLPDDEEMLSRIYNKDNVIILLEQYFQTKEGDITVFVKWEQDKATVPASRVEHERQVNAL